MILYPFTIMSIIFQNFRPEFMKIFISLRENITIKLWFEVKTQVIFIEQVPHIKVMCNSPIGYPKCKRGFPWLINIRENNKEMALVLFEVIMEGFNNSFGSGFKGQGLDLVFYF